MANTTADIWLKWDGLVTSREVFIEIKRNLRQKPQYDRLVGQIEGLRSGENKIVVVLCGGTSETLSSRLRDRYRQFMGDSDRSMDIVIN